MVGNDIARIENNRLIVIDWLIVDKRPFLRTSLLFYSPYTTRESHYREGCTPQETRYVLFLHPMSSPGIIECALSLAADKLLICLYPGVPSIVIEYIFKEIVIT